MTITSLGLTNFAYLESITELLLTARSEDDNAGIYEAADLQWWWREGEVDDPRNQIFWFDAAGAPVAAFLTYEDGKTAECDCFWLSSARPQVIHSVWPAARARLRELAARGLSVKITVDERDEEWATALEELGLVRSETSMIQMVQTIRPPIEIGPSLKTPPDSSLSEFKILDDRTRPEGVPHHLCQRNGKDVAARLQECSLYRADLDLVMKTKTGETAAYCLCWFDPRNRIGLFEPVRTEETFYRRGLGVRLMTEGLRRLAELGARSIKVTHRSGNTAASKLYEKVGFRPVFEKLEYYSGPPDCAR